MKSRLSLLLLILSVAVYSVGDTLGWGLLLRGVATVILAVLLSQVAARVCCVSRLLTLAQLTIIQARRQGVFLVMMSVSVLGLIIFRELPEASLSPVVQMKTFLTYSTNLIFFVGSLLALIHSTQTVCQDFRDKYVQLLFVKPLPRLHYLLGRLLGTGALLTIYTACNLGCLWAESRLFASELSGRAGSELIERSLLTGRGSAEAKPEPQSLARAVENFMADTTRELPSDPELARAEAEEVVRHVWTRSIPEKRAVPFVFDSIDKPTDARLVLRPVLLPPPSSGSCRIKIQWVGAESKLYVLPVGQVVEVPVPEDISVAEPALVLANFSAGKLSLRDGLEILYPASSYASNLLRLGAWLLIKLLFVCVLGLLAGSLAGFPVAILFCGSLVLAASLSGFVLSDFDFSGAQIHHHGRPDQGFVTRALNAVLENTERFGVGLLSILSAYSESSPNRHLLQGRRIPAGDLWALTWKVGLVWNLTALALASLIYRKKELARVQL